jgi:hypothetical protein
MALAETQELLVRIRYISDTSGIRNPIATIEQQASQAGSRAGTTAGRSYMDSFNRGLKSGRIGERSSAALGGGLEVPQRTVRHGRRGSIRIPIHQGPERRRRHGPYGGEWPRPGTGQRKLELDHHPGRRPSCTASADQRHHRHRGRRSRGVHRVIAKLAATDLGRMRQPRHGPSAQHLWLRQREGQAVRTADNIASAMLLSVS